MRENKGRVKSHIIQGFGSLIVREFFIKLFSFLGQLLLARLLLPSDFGIYVIIVFIVNLFGLFSDIGLSQSIIQKKAAPTRGELSGVFWLKTALSAGLIGLLWIFAPFVKRFYPSLAEANITMLNVFSVILLLTSFRTIPTSLLERQLRYKAISSIDILGVFVYYLVALLGAFLHFGVWSFITGAIAKEIVETVVINIVQPFIPRFTLSKRSVREMAQFGVYIQGNGLLMLFISSMAPAIGGRLSGPYAVGLLDFAYSIVAIPAVVSINFGRVAFAGYSRIREEKEALAKSIDKSTSMLAIILYIFPVVFFSFGRDLVYFLYTAKWLAAVPALYWFGASVFFYPTITAVGQAILSLGKSKEIFWATLPIAVLGGSGALLFVRAFGFTGIAMANVFIYFGMYVTYVYILRQTSFGFSAVHVLVPKVIAAACTIVFSLLLNVLLPASLPVLIVKLILSCAVYVVFMFICARQDTLELLRLVRALVPINRAV